MSLLLKNCKLLATEEGRLRVIERGFLGVEGERIDYIGSEAPEKRYTEERDLSGCLVMPGLVNCHGHAPMVLLRGLGSDLPLQEWLFDKMIPVEDRMIHADLLAGMELAQMEMLACGTTAYSEMYWDPCAEAELAAETGMKVNLCRVMQSFNPDEPYEGHPRARESIELFRNYHGAAGGRVRVDFCIHAEYTCYPHLMRGYAEDCRKLGAHMHIHLAETEKEQRECLERHGMTPTALMASLGVFDSPTAAAHCVVVTDEDMAILREKGVSPVHCPSSNLKLGSGLAPVPEMLALGLNVALGTDGAASNNNLNMFEELHLAAMIHKGFRHDPTLLPPETLLRMATVNGARLQGRPDTGSLEVGKKADLAVLDLDKPHLQPVLDPLALLAYSAQGSDVVMTVVDGRILYEKGEFLTIDAERVRHHVRQAVERLYGA